MRTNPEAYQPPISETEQVSLREKLQGRPLYAHFTRTREDAERIVQEMKLRESRMRKGSVYAVNLEQTCRDDRTQLGGRQWTVVFTTPEEGLEGEHPAEVFWCTKELPLDFAIVVPEREVRQVLNELSPEWHDWKPIS